MASKKYLTQADADELAKQCKPDGIKLWTRKPFAEGVCHAERDGAQCGRESVYEHKQKAQAYSHAIVLLCSEHAQTVMPKQDEGSGWTNEDGTPCDPEDTKPDWGTKCEVCEQSPVVPITGMCGPCTFGEAATVGGNW